MQQLMRHAGSGLDISSLATSSRAAAKGAGGVPKAPAKFVLTGHRAPITALACHPIFSLVVSGSEDTTMKLWDFETGVYESTLKGHTGGITALSYNNTGSLLASVASDMTCKLWDSTGAAAYQCIKTLRGHEHSISGVSFLAEHVYTCSRDQTIKVIDIL